jgi:hypothetical protein
LPTPNFLNNINSKPTKSAGGILLEFDNDNSKDGSLADVFRQKKL